MKEFVDSSPLLSSQEDLRERFVREGYLFFRGLFEPQILLNLRRQIVSIIEDCKWLKPGTDPMDAISWTVPKVEGEEAYFEAYDQVQRLQDLHALSHEEPVMKVMRALLGDTAFPHPLSIARMVFPDNAPWSTPPHQDYPNNQGTPELYAAWVPLSDCATSMGSLAILEGSHKLGLLPLEYALGDGHRQACLPPETESMSWVGSDFELGDVVVFHSLTVHRAMPNLSERMRLSVDYRFQAENEDLAQSCLVSHCERQDWDSIYALWDREDLKYYWQDKNFNLVPWDSSLGDLPDEHLKSAVKMNKQYNRERAALAKKYI